MLRWVIGLLLMCVCGRGDYVEEQFGELLEACTNGTRGRCPTAPPSWASEQVFLVSVLSSMCDSFARPLFHAWLEHYTQRLDIPAANVILIVHAPESATEDESCLLQVYEEAQSFGVVRINEWTQDTFTSLRKDQQRKAVMRDSGIERWDWVVYADSDELHDLGWSGPYRTVPALGRKLTEMGMNAMHGIMVDRIAEDGSLPPVRGEEKAGTLADQFPIECRITQRVAKAGCLGKVVMAKAYLALGPGAHWLIARGGCPPGQASRECCFPRRIQWFLTRDEFSDCCPEFARWMPRQVKVNHFKWYEGVIPRLERRRNVYRSLKNNVWLESQRLLDHLGNHSGRFCLDCEEDLACRRSTLP